MTREPRFTPSLGQRNSPSPGRFYSKTGFLIQLTQLIKHFRFKSYRSVLGTSEKTFFRILNCKDKLSIVLQAAKFKLASCVHTPCVLPRTVQCAHHTNASQQYLRAPFRVKIYYPIFAVHDFNSPSSIFAGDQTRLILEGIQD